MRRTWKHVVATGLFSAGMGIGPIALAQDVGNAPADDTLNKAADQAEQAPQNAADKAAADKAAADRAAAEKAAADKAASDKTMPTESAKKTESSTEVEKSTPSQPEKAGGKVERTSDEVKETHKKTRTHEQEIKNKADDKVDDSYKELK